MGRNNYFRFKQFTVIQEKSAMKVGIDGVLLGAWASVENPQKILDIGVGTGLIALMMAQRFSRAKIDAVEIDPEACKEIIFNFGQSLWNDRLQLLQISFQKFAETTKRKYDLIVSNPPFFENSVKVKTVSRELARNSESLSLDTLFSGVKRILSDCGNFSVVFPALRLEELTGFAKMNGLFLTRLTRVKPNPEKIHHRVLAEFSFQQKNSICDELIIESITHHDYTNEYRTLTRDFYLHF